jgi:DNA-binding beta-propeller fold protein YncE
MRRWTSRIWLPAALLLAAISSGCGKDSNSSGSSGKVVVSVSPQAIIVSLNSTQQFSATVSGAATVAIAPTNGAVRLANVVTITTTAAHGFAVGQTVTVSGVTDSTFFGSFAIVSVPTATTFTYAQTAADASSGGGTVVNVSVNWLVNDVAGGNSTVGTISTAGLYTAPDALPPPVTATITATGVARSAGVVTVTTTAAHNFVVNQIVNIIGVTDTSFNGSFVIATAPSTTTFTFSQSGSDATSGNGSITSFVVTIKAVSVADSTANATAIVDLNSGIAVRITPSQAVVGTSEILQFIATVLGSSNNAVSWAVNDIAGGNTTVGTITTGGLFTAPATPPTTSSATIATNGAVRTSTGAVRTSNVVLVTTTAAHGFAIGQSVTISGVADASFNGSFTIASLPSTVSFTYAQSGSNASSNGGTATSGSSTATITTGSIVTITTTAAHGFAAGASVTIASVSDASFNGSFTIVSVPSAATFTYSQAGANATSSGGTATGNSNSVTIKATAAADPTRSTSVLVTLQTSGDPTLTAISPSTAPQGAVFQDVFLTGTNFLSTSTVRINDTPLPPATISQFSSTLIRVRVFANLLASPGKLKLDVQRQNGTTSTPLNLTVVPVRPALVGASPDSGVLGGVFNFDVHGGYFGASTPSPNPSVTAKFDGITTSATVVPANEGRQVRVTVDTTALTAAGLYSVAILNNASNPALFTATNFAVRPSVAPSVLVAAITVESQPGSIAINEATGRAVVTNRCSGTISLIDVNLPTPATVGAAIPVGTYPTGVAVDAMRNLAVVANSGNNNVGCPPGPAGTPSLSIVDLATGTVTATITTNISAAPFSVAANPLTGMALVVYQNSTHADILDLTQVPPAIVSTTTITTGANPKVAMEPRLNWAVVTPGGAGTISIVDLGQRNAAAITSSSRAGNSTTITTAASHSFQLGQVVLISGVADTSFNGVFTISSVPSSTTFTFVQTAPSVSSSGGTAVATPYLATASIGPNVRGIGINTFTHQAILADTSANGPVFFNLFDQAVTNLALNEPGPTAAAFNPYTNIAVTTNTNTNEASVIDPEIPSRLNKLPVGSGPKAVAIDPGTNIALVVNETDGTVTAIDLGAIRPLHIGAMSMPLSRQLAPGVTLTSSVDLTLTIFGKGFLGSSRVRLDGVALTGIPTNVSDRQLTVDVPAALFLTGPHNYVLDVLNTGGALSNVLELKVVQAVDMVGAGGASCTAPAPAAVAIDADRDLAVVTNPGCDNVSFIDLASATITSSVTVQSRPRGVAVSPRLGTAVVTNSGSGSASILNLTTSPPTVTSNVSVGSEPMGVVIDESTGKAVVANASSNSISIFDASTGGSAQSVAVESRPLAVAIDPDRQFVAVANAASNTISVVDLNSLATLGKVPNVSLPTAVAFDPVTQTFIGNTSLGNALVLVNPDTLQASAARVGINPTAIAYNFNSSTLVTVNTSSKSISVMDFIQRRTREVIAISGSSLLSVAIHPRTNLAVVSDEANNRVLLVPLPR